jgi:putative solute:sodium symporter small subunit
MRTVTASASRASQWWRLNLCCIAVALVIWMVATAAGSGVFMGLDTKTHLFVLSSQVVPLVYLILVLVYGLLANRLTAHYALDEASDEKPS